MRPDIEQLKLTLKRGKANHLPLAELGIHPLIKEKFLGYPIRTLKDDVDFWHQAGYDYIKLQPGADFNPSGIGLGSEMTFNEDGTLSRKWATEGKGVITTMEEYEKYVFPEKADFDYSKFEQVKPLLPEGMGVVGQYGDIFTMTWEMMGFEEFSLALYMNPELIETYKKMKRIPAGEVRQMLSRHFRKKEKVKISEIREYVRNRVIKLW